MTSEHSFADNGVVVIQIPHKEDIRDSHEFIQMQVTVIYSDKMKL